jgi:AraC-like DNA-binding protein
MLIAPPLMHQVAGEMGFGPEQLHVRVRQAEDAAVFKAHDRFYRSLERPATALERQTLFANAVRGLLASSFGLRTKKLPGADGADAVDRARSYIESHFARNVGLEELATVAGMSRFQLLRAFKAKVGCGPHAFLIDRKLARARELLAQGQTPADTAAEVGFSDQSHLTRHFKRFFGATPARYQGRT